MFTENMKMADLVLANYRLLYVLPRFGISLGFREETIKNICAEKAISTPLFLAICNIYTHDSYLPDAQTLRQITADQLIAYLKTSHTDYRQSRLPAILSQMSQITFDSPKQGEILEKFCRRYEEEVLQHFEYEEKVVFPYIESLKKRSDPQTRFTIEEYEDNHSNIESALHDLKSIIIKYMSNADEEKCREMLIGISLFEDDLSKHSLLEERVLIPLVECIEEGHNDE